MKLLFSKSPSLGTRLVFVLFFAVILMVSDIKCRVFQPIRYYLDTAISPLYYLSYSPLAIFNSMQEMKQTRLQLMQDNTILQERLFKKKNDLLLLSQLKHENSRLRKLLGSPVRGDEHKMVAQVLLMDTNPYSYQVVLNKGRENGVYIGQPVLDEKGVVGQIFSVADTTSRAILVCDYQHAIPVQILRNNISMVAMGNGCGNNLVLDFLPTNNIDINIGDKLVTSGLDGRFPEGYPVGVVVSVDNDPTKAAPIIEAVPTADIKQLRYLLLWSNPKMHEDTQPTMGFKHG